MKTFVVVSYSTTEVEEVLFDLVRGVDYESVRNKVENSPRADYSKIGAIFELKSFAEMARDWTKLKPKQISEEWTYFCNNGDYPVN